MGRVRPSQFACRSARPPQRQPAVLRQPAIERVAVQEFHGEVRHAVGFADPVNRDQIVAESDGGHGAFAQEALPRHPLPPPPAASAPSSATDRPSCVSSASKTIPHATASKEPANAIRSQPAQLIRGACGRRKLDRLTELQPDGTCVLGGRCFTVRPSAVDNVMTESLTSSRVLRPLLAIETRLQMVADRVELVGRKGSQVELEQQIL